MFANIKTKKELFEMATKLKEPYQSHYHASVSWVKRAREAGKTWEYILLCGKADPRQARDFLARKVEAFNWPAEMSYARWKALVHRMCQEEKAKEAVSL